jgi:N-sulfoglucosamine sulfohydrolase
VRVPFIAYVPERYKAYATSGPGSENSDLVSFVDFGPTALNLAGVPVPDNMQGQPFLGPNLPAPPDFVFGYRGRADDMHEVSRAIHTGDFIYVRHFMPYLPYIQPGRIFGDGKTSTRELRRLRAAGELPAESEKMFARKPVEELYDLAADPHELNNLAAAPEHAQRIAAFRTQLHDLLIDIRDVGISFEPEMMIRSEGSSPYEMARDPGRYNVEAVVAAAELVGTTDVPAIVARLEDPDSIVRFWAIQALLTVQEAAAAAGPQLRAALNDASPAVAIGAVHALCMMSECRAALPTLEKWLVDERATTVLYAARTALLVGNDACSILPAMQKAIDVRRDDSTNSGFIDFMYSAFTGWALEEAVRGCGVELTPRYLG